jgi:hypothetical protein
MRRIRSDGPKVWHNPDVVVPHVRGKQRPAQQARPAVHPPTEGANGHIAQGGAGQSGPGPSGPGQSGPGQNGKPGRAGRVVVVPARVLDAKEAERERLLERLLLAEGRPRITSAADAFLTAGFSFPLDQDVQLQLLEHRDEGVIRAAIEAWTALLAEEAPRRRAVLESRLKRIQELAEEDDTKAAARRLFRLVTGRPLELDAV